MSQKPAERIGITTAMLCKYVYSDHLPQAILLQILQQLTHNIRLFDRS